MVSYSIKTLILSLSVASLANVSLAATPPSVNGCSALAAKQGTNITYADVAQCYASIPFNMEAARATLESLTTFFDDYYVSRDPALSPRLTKPLQSDPVDIVAKLKKIGRTRYTSDREFHTDVYEAVESLHDGHAVYAPYCYVAYIFVQPISMYAPVINGKQELKVYKDNKGRGYEDCTVVKIDGKNGMAQVKKRASFLMNSKDPNVRLNEALASMAYKPKAGGFVVYPGQFAVRNLLPERATVRYELQCGGSKKVKKIVVEDEWVINPQMPWQFTDTESYIKNVCLAPADGADASAGSLRKRDLVSISSERHDEVYALNKRAFDVQAAAAAAPSPTVTSPLVASPTLPSAYPEAIKIATGNNTVFYQLKDRPTIGVIVFIAALIDFNDIDFTYQSLETLYQKGVTDIIIDVVSGDGGYANVGPDFAQFFFPNKGPLDKLIKMNLRVTPAIQQLSAKVFNSTDGGYSKMGNMFSLKGGGFYDSSRFFDFANNRLYTDNSLYTDTVTETRNGRKAMYTKMTAYKPTTHPANANLAKYPWTNNPSRLRIITDGRCLSACANVVYYLANQYKVPTYGIGGTKGQPLSKYQYAAAGAVRQEGFVEMFAFGNMTSPLKPTPYQAIVSVVVAEFFAPGSKVPLEFDGVRYATDYRMDYDPVNARSREAMWTQVAKAAWK
ncbi:hypothetical protein BG015_004369 [Linnemannia schmuckeri]|uniref:Tail specific protease domain-containing protein n=1 Tax=Linnemannia schmuckeri TaxID=64567 RepID=A0A9P5V0C4_9FUNG|nr:hypothetical protein BG015_004369 [Linnemannia schmuckeri]